MKFTFRIKIVLLSLLLVLTTQIATLGSVSSIATQAIADSAANRLLLGGRIFTEFMASRSAQLETTLRVVAADFGFKQAVASNDVATISSALDNHRRRVSAEIALLLDLDGTVLVVSGIAPKPGEMSLPELTASIGDEQPSNSIIEIQSQYFQTFTAPVRAPLPVAWVVLGYGVDITLSHRVSMLTGLDVSFVDMAPGQPRVIASTLPGQHVELVGQQLYDAVAMRSLGESGGREIGAGDAVYLSTWLPFQKNESGVASVLHVSRADAYQPFYTARNAAVGFAAIALVLAVIGAGWLANAISYPVRRLAAAAARFASGDYEASVQVRSNDELGALASSFNTMRLAVAQREKKIRYAAEYDELTGLPNRNRLLVLMQKRIEHPENDAGFAVIKLEITQFVQLTATLGFAAGEELVEVVAKKLSGLLREPQVLARVDGAEFVAMLPGATLNDACAYIAQVQTALATGMRLQDATINLSCCAGIVLYPLHGDEPDDLLRRASIAKADARSNDAVEHCYEPGREQGHVRQLRIIGDLKPALADNQLALVYQPKLRIADRSVTSVEALVRWKHPELGPLAPDEFIGLAEQFGLIDHLTRWVIQTAIGQCGAWRKQGMSLDVAINLSARDLMDENLPLITQDALRQHDIDAAQVTIEVTESAIMRDLDKCISVLDCLRGIGVRIAIDDFGTGHSSLLQLKHMPLHELKIDRSFISGLLDNTRDDAIVRTTLDLAHRLDLEVVAEGIENDAVLERLAELGCEYAQGYSIARPLDPQTLFEWKRNYDTEHADLCSV